MHSKNISFNRISSRYTRRDYIKKISQVVQSNTNKINNNNNNDNNNIKKNITRLSSYVIRSEFAKRRENNKEFFNKSSSQIITYTNNKNEKLNTSMFQSNPKRYKITINQPRTPLISSSKNKISNISLLDYNKRRSIQTPQVNTNSNKDYIKVNNLTYYIRCPYCNHELNKEPSKHCSENKENINSNIIDNNKYKTEREVLKKITIIKDKEEFKNFYINEKGVIVFKEKDNPITSIQIVNSKPKLSKYSNELKVFGKKKNISIYEVPPPTTKVIVRPIKI